MGKKKEGSFGESVIEGIQTAFKCGDLSLFLSTKGGATGRISELRARGPTWWLSGLTWRTAPMHQRNPVEDGKVAELVRRRPQPSKSPNFYLFSVGTRLIRQEILGFSW